MRALLPKLSALLQLILILSFGLGPGLRLGAACAALEAPDCEAPSCCCCEGGDAPTAPMSCCETGREAEDAEPRLAAEEAPASPRRAESRCACALERPLAPPARPLGAEVEASALWAGQVSRPWEPPGRGGMRPAPARPPPDAAPVPSLLSLGVLLLT